MFHTETYSRNTLIIIIVIIIIIITGAFLCVRNMCATHGITFLNCLPLWIAVDLQSCVETTDVGWSLLPCSC